MIPSCGMRLPGIRVKNKIITDQIAEGQRYNNVIISIFQCYEFHYAKPTAHPSGSGRKGDTRRGSMSNVFQNPIFIIENRCVRFLLSV
jgi:hypothetical protein